MIVVRNATTSERDISYVLSAHRAIEGEHARFNRERLIADIFSVPAKATLLVAENESGQLMGMALYSLCYWASDGSILWVSQLYIEPSYRNGSALRVFFRTLQKVAKQLSCSHVVWGTQRSSERSNRL